MRNLKRALSLALAAAMLIGMMVIGASAAGLDDFSDKDEIVNQDAVSLLTILGVINGKEDGSYFDPTGNVTRAEMAKMIATILNQGADVDGLYVGIDTGLTDVKGHWAESYINFCYSLNIIAGRGNGKFDPTATVTGNEAAKMLLVAAGYDAEKEGLTGNEWAIRTAALASTLGIFDNLTVPTNDPLSRDNAALLIYNALDIEMIQKYDGNYAIAFSDKRTLLSTKYGVYKVEGVVVANEQAALDGTDSDDAAAAGKTKMDHVKVYASTTKNTTNQEYVEEKNPVTFNVSTTADMLGKTVTMYVKKTTVLADSQVLGIYLKDSNNVIKTTADKQDSMKDYLKGTGLTVDSNTQYYVNYGFVAGESAGTKAMGFESGDRFTSVSGKTNGSGIEMTVIDNDNDGTAEYVLWLQESLTQVIALNEGKETTTLSGFNNNKAIDNEDIVTDETLAEGDLYLAISYGGKYYVSVPEVVTGQMTAFSSSKEKQQYIEVGGEKYNPSFIQYKADSADNTYEFDILDCGTVDGVDFSIDYDFILDTNGNVIAYRPSEKGLYDFALILDSGYDPGRTNSNPTGEVKVLLPDGTEGTYTLNFSASAQNIGDQLYPTLTSTQRKDNGIETLKSFLGTAVTDNSTTKPDGTLKSGAADHFWNGATINASGHAEGYVVGYSLNSDNVLTITSIVGSNNTGAGHYNPTSSAEDPYSVAGTLSSDYNSGAARVNYNGGKNQLVIDKNTVAFYYTTDAKGDTIYGVAVGYEKMSDVKANDASHNRFVASTVKDKNGKPTTLSSSILFNAEGVVAEKDYAYVLKASTTDKDYVTLNVVLMDGTASTLKIERSDWDTLFAGKPEAFNTVYSYTVKNGIAELTLGTTYKAVEGYAKQLRDGTVALYAKNADGTVGAYISAYSYSDNIWNVEDLDAGDNAPKGAFSQGVYKDTILVLDAKEDTVRAAYIKSVYDGAVETPDHEFSWVLNNYKTLYPDATATDIAKAMDEGYNVKIVGDYTLTSNVYLRAGKTLYVTGNLTDTASFRVSGEGTLWVGNEYNVASGLITVNTQVMNDVNLSKASGTKIHSNLAIEKGNLEIGSYTCDVMAGSDVYVGGDVNGTGGTLNVYGHIEADDYNVTTINVYSNTTLIARGNLTATTLTVGDSSNSGRVQVAGTVTATTVNATKGSLSADKIVGTVNNSGDCDVAVKSGDSDVTLGGQASGSFAGDVTLNSGATVASGDTLTVDGDLTVSGANVTVSGTLNLNGSADISKLAGAQGGKVTFGSNFQATGTSTKFVTSTGAVLTADQLAGRSFTFDGTNFVTTSVLTKDAAMTVALTSPTGNSSYTINADAQAVTVTITDTVDEVKITATSTDKNATNTKLVETNDAENKDATVSISGLVITVDTSKLEKVGNTYTFKVDLSEDGKNTTTYTFTIKVVADASQP